MCPNSQSSGAIEESQLLFLFSFKAALLVLCIAEKCSKMLLPETRSQKTRTLHFFPQVLRFCSSFHDFAAVANSVKSFPSHLPWGPGGRSQRSRKILEGCDHTWWSWEGVLELPGHKSMAQCNLYPTDQGHWGALLGLSHGSSVTHTSRA